MKKKLTLTAYRDIGGDLSKIPDRDPFYVMLNPEDITIQAGAKYEEKALHRLKFIEYERPKLILPALIFDTTGAVPEAEWPSQLKSVTDMVLLLELVVYAYDNESHQNPIVQLTWGEINYYARVTRFNTKYSMFNSDGIPMRAEVTLTLDSYFTDLPAEYVEDRKSPNLTHLVEVKAGDSLPQMCYKVYRDSSYYLQIAQINNLKNFRQLTPGMKLEFPPIKD